MSASSTREGMLVLDLIDAKNKDLAWRLYLVQKIVKLDKDWKKADQDFTKGLERAIRRRPSRLRQRRKSGRTRSQSRNRCSERPAMRATAFPGWWREAIVDYFSGFAIR
jgi:hypothetical protein